MSSLEFHRRSLLVAALLLSPAMANAAPAGQVVFAMGEVFAKDTSGQSRPLSKNAAVDQGDTIVTHTGQAQVQFSDGSYMSFQPNTEFRIDEYRFNGQADGSEKGNFSLVKGVFRTVSGLIGHTNRQTYKVTTPVATIGIRGTEYFADFREELSVGVAVGCVGVTNEGGDTTVCAGESCSTPDSQSKCHLKDETMGLQPDLQPLLQHLDDVEFSINQNRNEEGGPAGISAPCIPTRFSSAGPTC